MINQTFEWGTTEKEYFFKASPEEKKNAAKNACLARNWEAFEWIVNNGFDINSLSYELLWDAVRKEDVFAVKKLIELNFNVHRVDDVAFRDAVRLGNTTIMKLLFTAGANIHAVNDESMSLAAERGDVYLIRQLAQWGVPATGWKNDPLVRAAENQHVEATKELLKLGATLDDEEKNYLPIKAAIRQNNAELGQILLKSINSVSDVVESIEESSSLLPENWKEIINHWHLSLAIKN